MNPPTPTIFHLDDGATWGERQQQVMYVHQGLLAEGFDSRVVCQKDGAFQAALHEQRLPHYAMRMTGGRDPGASWRIRNLLREPGSILHTHTAPALELGLWASRFGARSSLVVSRWADFAAGYARLSRWNYLSGRIDRYLAASSSVELELVRAGIDASRIRQVPCGIDLSRFEDVEPDLDWRKQFGLDPGELLFCNDAELVPDEDQTTLLSAFRQFLDGGGSGRLVLLGEGEARTELERQARQLGLDGRVFFAGSADAVLAKLRASDVFVVSSRTAGPSARILDAMALARPVVATSTGGSVDLVEHEESGLLVPAEDPRALARAFGDLQESAATRQRMGLAGQRRVVEFDLQRTVRRTIDAYQELFPAHDARP